MTIAYVLGAGFSKAASPAMPLMNDLGIAVSEQMQGRQTPTTRLDPSADLEVWLNYVLDTQPYLSSEENLLNQAAGQAAVQLLQEIVVRRQGDAEREAVPRWLDDLITVWHARRSNVVTLNWDTLVEDLVDALGLWSIGHSPITDQHPVSSDDVLAGVPRLALGSSGRGHPGRSTFRLSKLHGSIDWCWSEGDALGESVVRRPHSRPVLGDTAGIAGKTPFFAAPTALKSSHYRNQVVRHVWRQAHHAIRNADTIVLIGYSLPTTDLTVLGLLAADAARRNSPGVLVEIPHL